MKKSQIIPEGYIERLGLVLDRSWEIFKSQFINNKFQITKEAPFQLHLAFIIRNMGDLFCIKRKDLFFVDLETKIENIKGKNKNFDITCGFITPTEEIKCAIELKFKTKKQAAQDWGRIDAYADIEGVELTLDQNYSFGRFYMITDSTAYIKKSLRGVGTEFCMYDGHISPPNKTFHYNCQGREHVYVRLKKSYKFEWERINEYYFLELKINRTI